MTITTYHRFLHRMALASLLILAGCSQPAMPEKSASARVALGKALFFDSSLSADGKISCASCHVASKAFTDGRTVSIGVNGKAGTRNATGLAEVRLHTALFWDGREAQLTQAVLQPFTNPNEMGLADLQTLVDQINAQGNYAALTRNGFGDPELDSARLAETIGAYLRSLPMSPTRYDLSISAPSVLNIDESAGLALFKGKAACATCHHLTGTPVTLTDDQYHHTGIGFEQIGGDVVRLLDQLDEARRRGRPIGEVVLSDETVAELGRFAVTRRPTELGAFRTPSLRNVALTAPYMHDGSIPTLKEAVEREIYYRSLTQGRSINLTVEEQRQLVAFLGALTATVPSMPPGSDISYGLDPKTSTSREPASRPSSSTSTR
ncbi:MAG: cytochrome c peroxidase [Glutamicibacter sp.]